MPELIREGNYNTNGKRAGVIGNPVFLKLVEQLEKDEDITFGTFDIKESVVIPTIELDQDKADQEVTVPILTEEITSIDLSQHTHLCLPKKKSAANAYKFHYEGMDIISLQKLIALENIDGAFKNRTVTIFWENNTLLMSVTWSYVKVPQVEFEKLQPAVWSDIVVAFGARDSTTL